MVLCSTFLSHDSIAYHNLIKFTTKDNDNDDSNWASNCAIYYTGGWWYKNCCNLNGCYGVDDSTCIDIYGIIGKVGITLYHKLK